MRQMRGARTGQARRPPLDVHQSVFGFSRNSNAGSDLLNDDYTLISPRRGSFKLSLNAAEEWLCFFCSAMAPIPAASHVGFGAEPDTEGRK
jgi:hypothetical protein